MAFFCLLWSVLCVASAGGQELSNETIQLRLGFNENAIPIIEAGTWIESGLPVFTNEDSRGVLNDWVPEQFIPDSNSRIKQPYWRITQGPVFTEAEATRYLINGLKITWIVELANEGSLVRLHVRLKNLSKTPKAVDWFPGWTAVWRIADEARWARWWRSLSFKRIEEELNLGGQFQIESRLHSSDNEGDGVNPYWIVGGKDSRIYFGLEWCGGWEAKVKGSNDVIQFSVRLPSEETQLTLNPGEAIEGPVVVVTPTQGEGEIENRYYWMMQRRALAERLYNLPYPSFPLSYNHWYAAGFDVDAEFLNRQIEAMPPYGFDAFVVDAGWYDKVGDWEPSAIKFAPGEFEQMLESVKAQGVKSGIWSSPQFISVEAAALPPEVDEPAFYEDFIDGYLIDLADNNFKQRLLDHVAMLRERYSVDWWKYDQRFFTDKSRAGVMKNVVAFQDALRAVRQANPDLIIENSQSGGRMINELTMLAAQYHWLRDGRDNGLSHARQNITVALGALQFMFPWTILRWTNNLDQMDQKDDELTRLYCRSAMAGTWGIVSDLSKIKDRQRKVILEEIAHYRQLNQMKENCLYDLQLPGDDAAAAGVIFYDAQKKKAGLLLYRWDRSGPFNEQVILKYLQKNTKYRVTDVDGGVTSVVRGKALMNEGLSVPFNSERLSAMVFIEAVE